MAFGPRGGGERRRDSPVGRKPGRDRPLRAYAQRDLDRGDDGNTAARRCGPGRTGGGRRHLRGGWPAGRGVAVRRLLFRPAKGLRVRRRAVVGSSVARGGSPGGAHKSVGPVRAGVPGPVDCHREQPAGPDVQHTRDSHLATRRRTTRMDIGERRYGVLGRPVRPLGRDPLRLGRVDRLRRPVRGQAGRTLPRRRDHRFRGDGRCRAGGQGAAGERDRRHRALPEARAQPATYSDVPGHRAR